MIKRLQQQNKFQIYSVKDPEFSSFGRTLTGYDWKPLQQDADQLTIIPTQENVYVPSMKQLEELDIKNQLQQQVYGGMPIQIGYCNGNNSKLNALEFHQGSEINLAVTPMVLFLAHTWQMKHHQLHSSSVKCFYLPEGVAVELFQTTMHFAPCKVSDRGFKSVVILLQGTNSPLEKDIIRGGERDDLLFKQNKWLIAHPARTPLVAQGAYVGLEGENLTLCYEPWCE